MPDGLEQGLNLNQLVDRHLRQGWVETIHSSQSATADRVMAHLESFRANIVDARAIYVAISRARTHAAIYTDDRSRLTHAVGVRDGIRVATLDHDAGFEIG